MARTSAYAMITAIGAYVLMSDPVPTDRSLSPTSNTAMPGLDQRFWDDFQAFESYNIDYDYFASHPFKGTRCTQSESTWVYEDAFCDTKGDAFGLKENVDIFGLSRSKPKRTVYSVSCIHSNATMFTRMSASRRSIKEDIAWLSLNTPDGLTMYETAKATKRKTGFSTMMGMITATLPKWKQLIIAREDTPNDYMKVGTEVAMYFHHNQTSFRTTCALPHMKDNLVCTYQNKCSAGTTFA